MNRRRADRAFEGHQLWSHVKGPGCLQCRQRVNHSFKYQAQGSYTQLVTDIRKDR
jgi:hypothetical protein